MEVGVATAPVGDLGEGVSDENILVGTQDSHSTREPQPLTFLQADQGCLLK